MFFTGSEKLNTVGYCLGGIIAQVTLAYLAALEGSAEVQDLPAVNSATFFTSHQGQAEHRYISMVFPGTRWVQTRIQKKPAFEAAILLRNIYLIRVLVLAIGHKLTVAPELFEC